MVRSGGPSEQRTAVIILRAGRLLKELAQPLIVVPLHLVLKGSDTHLTHPPVILLPRFTSRRVVHE